MGDGVLPTLTNTICKYKKSFSIVRKKVTECIFDDILGE